MHSKYNEDNKDEEVDTGKEDKDVYKLPTRRKSILKELLQLWNCVHHYHMALDDDNFQSNFEMIKHAILVEYLKGILLDIFLEIFIVMIPKKLSNF